MNIEQGIRNSGQNFLLVIDSARRITLCQPLAAALASQPMTAIPVHDLIPVLQVAIGPVILISGVGLVLLTLTNRFGRAVDRSRALGREVHQVEGKERVLLRSQVEILYRRARVIRLSIIMAAMSLLLAAVLIIVLFIAALSRLEAGQVIILLFICCLLSLIVSLLAFIRDIQLSLHALKLELGEPD
jgi:hypothetical protein